MASDSKPKPKGVFDDRLIQREWYNLGKYPIKFVRDKRHDAYVVGSTIPIGPEKFILKPREFQVVPHAFYIGICTGGSPQVEILENFGDAIGKGNRLPSAPLPEFAGKN